MRELGVGILALLFLVVAAYVITFSPEYTTPTESTPSSTLPEGSSTAKDCSFDEPPGRYIMYLLSNHDVFEYDVRKYPEERRIEWEIRGPPEALEVLRNHIEQMSCILKSGGTPRAHDPLFVMEARVAPYVNTLVELQNGVLRVYKEADNECAYAIISLHADVIKGFFERGREEAMKTHPVPDDVLQLCEEYV